MPVPLPVVAAGAVATAAYLDAKWLIRQDLSNSSIRGGPQAATKFIEESMQADRMLNYHVLEDHALRNRPDQIFLLFEGKTWTYKQFYDDVQRAGNWLLKDLGIEKGEIVALDGPNSPEFLVLWFALDGIAACPAFINSNLTSQALIHCVKLSDSRYLIADEEIHNLCSPCEDELSAAGVQTIYYGPSFISSLSDTETLPKSRQSGIKPDELRSLIYTSGTTGMPKGTMLLTGRELNTGRAVADYLKLDPSSRMYTCMPLFHGAPHGLCVTPCLHAGGSIALGRKFSHRTFWPEVRQSKANILQYVGELCRYLVNAEPSPTDKQHSVTMAWGNGMRPDVWDRFRDRFGIEIINELYAGTDGIISSFNWNRGDFGKYAIGKRGLIWHLTNGRNEINAKIDPDTEELLRDSNGFAIKCKRGEPGEALAKMDPENPAAAFAGYYKNPEAGQKRIIRDVFQKGDMWFRSGDMLRTDESGVVYFVDRLGDTFRWKSENVSTNEVSDVVGKFPQIAECNVYGVQVPKSDGRCGCAAITFVDGVTETTFDYEGLARWVRSQLPGYAVPIFIRVGGAIEYTGTMKMQKGRLRREGIDLGKVEEDRIYWLPVAAQKGGAGRGNGYVRFTEKDWDDLKAGYIRL